MTDGEADMEINALSIIGLYIHICVGCFLCLKGLSKPKLPHMLTFLILYLVNCIQGGVFYQELDWT